MIDENTFFEGLNVQDAIQFAQCNNMRFRIVYNNTVILHVPQEYDVTRFNFVVINDIVVVSYKG